MHRWRSVLLFGVLVVVTLWLLEGIHPSATDYAYWAATVTPIEVIDLTHADHSKSPATGKPARPRPAERLGRVRPSLALPVGFADAFR